jgi:EAL domain-containing protein (putative c-di-GMP-specific phosphodiesterase class I)
LHTHGFVDSVRAILKETGLEPHFLELEIAETTLQRQVQGAAAVLQKLRDIGVRIALDDFGTGYSSLSSLKNLPIDTLKIDQVLVKELAADTSNGATIQALIRMGGGLNVRVVAEGVETPEQIARLRRHGCSEAQGHYFGRSLGGGEIAAMLVRGWCNMAFNER